MNQSFRTNKQKTRYVHGQKIESMADFIERLDLRLPFYFHRKFMAAGFIEHWSFVQVRTAIKYGSLECATEIEEHYGDLT